jgi:hypothetical protein
MLDYYVFALFFATIILLSRAKKNKKMARYYKEEHKR